MSTSSPRPPVLCCVFSILCLQAQDRGTGSWESPALVLLPTGELLHTILTLVQSSSEESLCHIFPLLSLHYSFPQSQRLYTPGVAPTSYHCLLLCILGAVCWILLVSFRQVSCALLSCCGRWIVNLTTGLHLFCVHTLGDVTAAPASRCGVHFPTLWIQPGLWLDLASRILWVRHCANAELTCISRRACLYFRTSLSQAAGE